MSGRGNRGLGAVNERSRQISRSGGGGGAQHPARGGSRGGSGGRGGERRTSGRQRNTPRGRGNDIFVPLTPEEWEDRLEGEARDAFMDFTLAFRNSGIPLLPGIRARLLNIGAVAGQEIHALMLAALRSIRLGRVCYPDGTIGERIRSHVLEEELARVGSGA